MDINWDHELSEVSCIHLGEWIINESDIIYDTTTTVNDNMANEPKNNEEQGLLNDEQLIDEEENLELINDSWTNVVEDVVDPTEQQKLIINVLKKCRAISKIVNKSSIIADFVRKEQKALKLNRSVNNDCPSRWNSTFVLADALIELKIVIIKLFSEKESLDLGKEQIIKLSSIELNNENWNLLSSLQYVLKPFFFATNIMSGKNYPTVGLSYYALHKIKWFCNNSENCNEQIKRLKKILLDKLNQYFYYDDEQLQQLKCFAYFDPAAHLCFSEKEKHQIERYIKELITDDIYPLDLPSSTNNSTNSSTIIISSSVPSIITVQTPQQPLEYARSKSHPFDEFVAACGEEDNMLVGNVKERSRRICINEELKQFKLAVAQFNTTVKPSSNSALLFWKTNKDRLLLLSHLAKVHLIACATSVPTESAFSSSSYLARKERSRITGQNLSYTMFLKDKI
ncbi:unnamed protein product [Rotaria sp. Silwood2]|nr:unnamed protein product [Rotaria sp. Silwood2]CAF4519855.1 unnamed protein product [Rotaria sp. Silwood2]